MVSGTRTLAADPLGPHGCEMGPPRTGLVCLAHPIGVALDGHDPVHSCLAVYFNSPVISHNVMADRCMMHWIQVALITNASFTATLKDFQSARQKCFSFLLFDVWHEA